MEGTAPQGQHAFSLQDMQVLRLYKALDNQIEPFNSFQLFGIPLNCLFLYLHRAT